MTIIGNFIGGKNTFMASNVTNPVYHTGTTHKVSVRDAKKASMVPEYRVV